MSYALQKKKVNYVLDADIRGFFDNLDKRWLIKFVELHEKIGFTDAVRLIAKKVGLTVPEVAPDACGAEARSVAGRTMTVSQILAEIERDVVFFDESGGGVTFTGGEPFAQPELLEALLRACRGLHIVGADVVEVLPDLDSSHLTATLAATVAWEILSLIATEWPQD